MCNLYGLTRGQEAIRRLFRVKRDLTGNRPGLPAIYPDTMAPVVRTARDGERGLILLRWGFPPPPNLGKVPVTNVGNLKSPYWRGWLNAEWRCLVPATSFCEWTDSRPKGTHWFALDERRPPLCLCGNWAAMDRRAEGRDGRASALRVLTTESNDIVRPIHAKAMPVLLTNPVEWDTWLGGSVEQAIALQRPLANELLRVVASGEKSDQAPVGE
jgi:putative SOS response-associated peptidase YedK